MKKKAESKKLFIIGLLLILLMATSVFAAIKITDTNSGKTTIGATIKEALKKFLHGGVTGAAVVGDTCSLDQSSATSTGYLYNYELAQSFVPTTNKLGKVSLYLTNYAGGTGTYTINLADGPQLASSTVLGSASIDKATIPSYPAAGWVDFYFNPDVNVVPGNTYYIVVPAGEINVRWNYGRDSYPNGLLYRNGVAVSTYDFAFMTYSCVSACTDADADGYSLEGGSCGPIDCDDTNSNIYPGQNMGICAMCDSAGSGNVVLDAGYSCPDTTCPQDGCGSGSCGTNIYGDYPATVSNYCEAVYQCSQNTCEATCESDLDNDGYSTSCGDCNDNDVSIHQGLSDGYPYSCNGVDNNCDGNVDTDCPCISGQTQQCGPSTDIGACIYGTQTCDVTGTWGDCIGAVMPSDEICNDNKDNDCDGVIDNTCSKVDKSYALTTLQGLYTSNSHTRKELDKAINHLQKSLSDPKIIWSDNTHLACKHGNKAFDEEKKTVKKLMKVSDPEHKKHYDASIEATVDELITLIMDADKLLATTLISEATASNSNQEELEKANKEMGKAEAARALGDFDKAIEDYKKAWQHAKKAVYKDYGCDYCDLDWEDDEQECGE